jgi:ribonucleases P/MRP protein subunit RPP40
MEQGGQVDVIYTDFAKAFDRVDHVILLNKLQALGIHGDLLRWTKSYLTNRSQAVVLGGCRSCYVNIPTGVPQGSHLGPLLYNAYLYDLGSCLKNTNYLMYADDKKVYYSINSVNDCLLIQKDLDILLEYYNKNNITINAGKCECITFTRKSKPILNRYHFDGVEIVRKDVVRDLDVYLDSKMTFSEHIDFIVNKSYKNLGFVLRVCKPLLDLNAIKVVFNAYVRSVLEYASSVWSPQYDIYISRLERIQKIFVNHLNFRCRQYFKTYADSCNKHGLLSLANRRIVSDMALLYDIINGNLFCPNLVSKITFRTPNYRTRRKTLLVTPKYRTNYCRNAILSRLARTYNEKFGHIDIFMRSNSLLKMKLRKCLRIVKSHLNQ